MLETNNLNSVFYIIYCIVKKLTMLSVTTLLVTSVIYSTNVPPKVNLKQPNGYAFTAYGEGDEFLHRFKTPDNYTIVCSTGDWWYYAYQGTDGKLYPTQYRVGIEDNDAMSTLAQDNNYSTFIITQAKNERVSFSENITIASVSPKSLGVILIDFPNRIASRTDPAHPNDPSYISNNWQNASWEKRYTMSDFENLFFSENSYNNLSPDGFPVFGSFNDYNKEVSYGDVYIYGNILNLSDNGKPIWHRANHDIEYYNTAAKREELIAEAKSKAIAAGFNPNNYFKICIIYAGQWGNSAPDALWPRANWSLGHYIMGERNPGWDYDIGFGSIGVHVHEFAHLLGLKDMYDSHQVTCGVGCYFLMGYGNMGALLTHHSKPVLMSAWEKQRLGYINTEIITTNKTDYILPNIEEFQSAFAVFISTSFPSEYFMVENRQPIGFDSDISVGGLLITHYKDNPFWPSPEPNQPAICDIEEVGGIAFDGCGVLNNRYPLDFYYRPINCGEGYNSQIEDKDFMNIQNQVFGPWSSPNSHSRLNSLTDIAIVFKQYQQPGSAIKLDIFKTGAINAPPSKPQNPRLFGTPKFGWVEVRWDANQESDVNLYEVSRMIPEFGGTWSVIGTTTNTFFRDTEMFYAPGGGLIGCHYKVRAKDTQNKYSTFSDEVSVRAEPIGKESYLTANVEQYELSSNYPNPFNPSTVINYAVKDAGIVKLKVYDILGAEVAELVNETKEPGYYSIEFNASQLTSGVYIYTLQVNGYTSSKKMMLMK